MEEVKKKKKTKNKNKGQKNKQNQKNNTKKSSNNLKTDNNKDNGKQKEVKNENKVKVEKDISKNKEVKNEKKENTQKKLDLPKAKKENESVLKNNKKSDNEPSLTLKENNSKKKLNKYEKREAKIKKQNDLLNLRGIHKFWSTNILELIFIFAVEIIAKALLGNLALDFSLLRIFLSSCVFAIILTTFTNNLPNKVRKTILIIFNFLIVFYAWLQLGFVNFLGNFMSLGNAEQGTKITSYIWEFLCAYKPVLHLVYIPFILTILYFVFERRITKDGYLKKFPFKSILCDLALVVYICLLLFVFMMSVEIKSMQNKFQTVSNKELLKYPSSPALAIKNFGTTVYFLLDVKGTIKGPGETQYREPVDVNTEVDLTRKIDDTAWRELSQNETDKSMNTLNKYFMNRSISPTNEYTGKFEGKNLIMIMMESVSEAVFHEEYKEYFPTLYKLYSEGITGINNYSPKNNCATGESEMTSQIGLYSIETTCTVNTYKNNEYKEALLYMMRKNNYYTTAYHDYTDQYYSRSTIEYKFGAYKYYGVTDLGMSYNYEYKEWPSDLTFVEKALPKILSKDKFAAYMVTVSAHTPYIYSSEMGDKHLSLFKNSGFSITTKRYLSKVKELDLALEYMLKTLEEEGKLDDTVIVLFGDHYPYGLSSKEYDKLAPYDTQVNQEVDRTPFIIYNKGTEPEKIEKYTTPVDYAPTLLNLFGIDFDPRLYLGHDIFSDYNDYAVFPDNSWQSKVGFYSSSKGEFIPKDEGTIINDEEIIKINTEINDMRNMSALAIKKNYFKYLYNYLEEYDLKHNDFSNDSGESNSTANE